MNALMICMFAMSIGISSVCAAERNQAPNITVATNDDEEREIPLDIRINGDMLTLSLFHPTVHATLYNKVVSVDLSELSEGAVVTVTSMATGEVVYSQTGMGCMEIDLSACGKGQHQIDIVSGELWLQGHFTL